MVPRISEYANTQNRVNAADFFSNHPFHVRMEGFSRRIWTPAQKGAQRETRWFYERAWGQYADAQSRLTAAEQRRFKSEHPNPQMFTKTDLAKFENVWDDHPRWVNLGSQRNFGRVVSHLPVLAGKRASHAKRHRDPQGGHADSRKSTHREAKFGVARYSRQRKAGGCNCGWIRFCRMMQWVPAAMSALVLGLAVLLVQAESLVGYGRFLMFATPFAPVTLSANAASKASWTSLAGRRSAVG